MDKKNFWLIVSTILIVIIFIILILNFLDISTYPFSKEICGCQNKIPDHYFLVFGIVLIIASIPISYRFISKRMENRLEKKIEILATFVDKKRVAQNSNPKFNQSILRFFNNGERKIMENLIENNGKALQSEMCKIKDMTKLKVHRAVKSLKEKGLIKLERHRKTNKISLTNDFKKPFKF